MNIENKNLYEDFYNKHINENGTVPIQYAITELIRNSIINRTYKLYLGGGYEYHSNREIKKYDIIAYFTMGGDPVFMMCKDNSDGDCCEFICTNEKNEILYKNF